MNRFNIRHGKTGTVDESKIVITLNHQELSDEELVRSFVETQDEEAFNTIVNRYGDKIYRLLLRITRNPSDAEEVLQEVFMILVEKLDTFREGARFSTWLYRVAANAGFIHLRAQKKFRNNVSLEDSAFPDSESMGKGVELEDWSNRPDEILLSTEAMEMIERAVSELPEAYNVAFHLRDIEGLTNPEVAEILGLSLTAVKSRVHRARLFLRDRLSSYFSTNSKNYSHPSYIGFHPNG